MTNQLAFGTLAGGSYRGLAHAPTGSVRRVCTRTTQPCRPSPCIAASTRPRIIHGSPEREKFAIRRSLAARLEATFAIAVLVAFAAIESYCIAQAALSLQTRSEPRARAIAAATPHARETAPISPRSSRLALLGTLGSYLASGLGGIR